MNLFIYSSKSNGNVNRLHRQVESCNQGYDIETFNSVAHLSRRFCQPRAKWRETIVVLLAADRKDLANLLSIRDLLDDVRIILVLPDDKKETVSAGHLLRPRYISYADGKFEDVAAVLRKTKERFGRNKIKQKEGDKREWQN